MKCPACGDPMVVLEHESVEIDYCTACQGIWLDAGELELLSGEPRAPLKLSASRKKHAAGEKSRRCPLCGKRMSKVEAGHDLVMDRCPRGDGLWLDKQELERFLAWNDAPETDNLLKAFLNRIFGGAQSGDQ